MKLVVSAGLLSPSILSSTQLAKGQTAQQPQLKQQQVQLTLAHNNITMPKKKATEIYKGYKEKIDEFMNTKTTATIVNDEEAKTNNDKLDEK